jgi:hypothetical protein
MEKQQDKKVLGTIGKIDLPKINVSKYIGKKAKIESIDIYEGSFGQYVKILTETLEILGTGKNQVCVKASKILGLQQDSEGLWGYGEGTKLDAFLKKYKCDVLNDLIGVEVILQSQISKENNTEFISFN